MSGLQLLQGFVSMLQRLISGSKFFLKVLPLATACGLCTDPCASWCLPIWDKRAHKFRCVPHTAMRQLHEERKKFWTQLSTLTACWILASPMRPWTNSEPSKKPLKPALLYWASNFSSIFCAFFKYCRAVWSLKTHQHNSPFNINQPEVRSPIQVNPRHFPKLL